MLNLWRLELRCLFLLMYSLFNTMHFIGTTIGVALGAMMLKLFQMPTERESIMKALPNVMFLSIAVLCIIFLLTVTKFKNYKAY